jgi:ArsR family transcriptional regulator, arsenate/arsenite/antimonite-responsive transcriptional repressor
MPALDSAPDDDYERRVFRAFVVDGRLKAIPAKRRKREVLLRRIVDSFQRERVYQEREVNTILRRFHEDVAFLRRELVDLGLLVRYRGEYVRPD